MSMQTGVLYMTDIYTWTMWIAGASALLGKQTQQGQIHCAVCGLPYLERN